ncbi:MULTISPECIES: hypothetical protein [Burkholderia]|uniref:hypothetical protein n=1 Tax=Burkholderia TaxID=32008 RepID=UPI001F056619|nr:MULTISPECIES: hypothetical protein [Burkholderia]
MLNEAIEEKVFAGRSTVHDMRAYYATQHKDKRGALPDLHANPATTARVYDRNKIVKRCEVHFVEFQNKNGTVFLDSAVFNNLIPLGILWGG